MAGVTPVRVYCDMRANAVVFEQSDIEPRFIRQAAAFVEVDDQLNQVVTVQDAYTAKIMAKWIDPELILDENGDVVSADATTVVRYLNEQFARASDPPTPAITSVLNVQVVEGVYFNYTIETNFVVRLFGATGLPDGLFLNQTTGEIVGITNTLGTTNVTITAVSGTGVVEETLAIEVLSSGVGWVNTDSISFIAGQNDHVAIGTDTALDSLFDGNTAYSLTCFVKRTASAGDGVVLSKFIDNEGTDFYLDASHRRIALRMVDSGGGELSVRTGNILPLATWCFIAVTYDGSGTAAGVNLYYGDSGANVALQGKTTLSDTLTPPLTVAAPPLMGVKKDSVFQDPLGAVLDEFCIWDKVLSLAELEVVFKGGGVTNLTPGDPSTYLFYSNLDHYYRMFDNPGSSFPTMVDSRGALTGICYNMSPAQVVTDTP